MEKVSLEIPLILSDAGDCQHCLDRLREELRVHKGVAEVHVDREDASACLALDYDPSLISPQQVEETARRVGLEITDRYAHARLPLAGLDCADCARTIEEGVGRLPGVVNAAVALLSGTLTVEYERAAIDREQIEARVRELGHSVASEEGTWTFRVEGMDCADCAATIEKVVAALSGVRELSLSFTTGRLEVRTDDPGVLQAIEARLRQLGYQAQLESGQVRAPRRTPAGFLTFLRNTRSSWYAIGAALFILLGLALFVLGLPGWTHSAAFALAIVVGGMPVARAGWAALRTARSLDINALMTIAAIGAMAVGEWAEGAVTIFLFALGELLERYTMDRARGAIRALMDLSPQEASRLVEGGEQRIPVEALRAGDRLRVRPGERLPADGEIEEGRSAVDQAAITGESVPVDKGPGDKVYAGTLNGEGLLVVRVTRAARESTLARIIAMVEQAQARKAPVQRFIDRFARIYTPAVVGIALLVASLPPLLTGARFVDWFYRALVLLVIACPCALVLSTPVSIASAISSAARVGVLIKGGAYLEALGRLKAFALDKTGTLTAGRPAISSVTPYNGHSEGEVLQVAAAVESGSSHPLARAVVHEAGRRGLAELPAEDFQTLTGRGASATIDGQRFFVGNHTFFEAWGEHPAAVCAEVAELENAGQTAILVGTETEVWGAVALADQLRPQSRAVVEELRQVGLQHIVMLTGDNRATAEAIARQAGVDDVRANLLPEHKVDAIEGLLRRFGTVGMIGDGVNDAPALARATVGVAMGAIGSDAALETADVALMTNDLARLPATIRLGHRARRIVAQNIALSLGLKAVFLALAVAGLATLWMAVFADMGASLLVTLNGMRLLLNDRDSE